MNSREIAGNGKRFIGAEEYSYLRSRLQIVDNRFVSWKMNKKKRNWNLETHDYLSKYGFQFRLLTTHGNRLRLYWSKLMEPRSLLAADKCNLQISKQRRGAKWWILFRWSSAWIGSFMQTKPPTRSMRSFMPSIMSKKFYSDKALNWFSPWPPSFSFLPDPVFCKRNRLFNFCRLSLFSCPSPFWRQAWSRQQVIVLKADVHRHFFFFLLIKNGLYEFYILWKEVTLGVKKIRHFYFQERSRVEWNRAVTKILR